MTRETVLTIAVKVIPRASKNAIAGREGDAIKIRLSAPPAEGKANEALVKFLADRLGVSRAQIEIVAGHRSRRKLLRLRGVSEQQVTNTLG